MVQKLDIHGIHTEVSDKLKQYITSKINHLEKYVPTKSRESLHVEVFIEEDKNRSTEQMMCEVIFHLPKQVISAKEGTLNFYSAMDMTEEKLKGSLTRYKQLHDDGRKERHLINRAQLQSEV